MSATQLVQVTVAHDGSLTREGARVMRSHGAPSTVTGLTTLGQARKVARSLSGVKFEFVQATRPQVPATRARKTAMMMNEPTGYVRAQIQARNAARVALAELSALAV